MARVVLDANVVISAVVKDSFTRELITKAGHEFWFPEPALRKMQKYRGMILEKSGLSPRDLDALFGKLFEHIEVAPAEMIAPQLAKAESAIGQIDLEDAVFVACALSLPNSAIWSNDKHLKKQKLFRVYTTEEMRRVV